MPEGVRPTSARVREALFSLLGSHLHGRRVLDACGGSGLLSLEAWSRGATVTVVERDRRAAEAIRANARDFAAPLEIVVGDVWRVVPDLGTYDIVIGDPPYADDPDGFVALLAPHALDRLVLETGSRVAVATPDGLVLDRSRTYGGTTLWVFHRPEAP